tara:strand:- start:276 stop:389 length:114 start_codon:yes stop_codon:yes gene_type:complete
VVECLLADAVDDAVAVDDAGAEVDDAGAEVVALVEEC